MATLPFPQEGQEAYSSFRKGILDALEKVLKGAYQDPKEARPDLNRAMKVFGAFENPQDLFNVLNMISSPANWQKAMFTPQGMEPGYQ